jgi:TonB family protein
MVRFLVHLLVALAAIATSAAFGQGEQPLSNEQDIVSASTLTRTHTVPPAWPQSASGGVEGWVLLNFTVLADGTVADIEVKEASPAGIFGDSAVEALRQWKYESVERDGKKVPQRAEIRMNYALGK